MTTDNIFETDVLKHTSSLPQSRLQRSSLWRYTCIRLLWYCGTRG